MENTDTSSIMATPLSPSSHCDPELKRDDVVYVKNDESLPTSPTSILPGDNYGARPAVFSSTFQEVLFVLVATMAIGTSSMASGSVTVITSFVGKELDMSTAEITWISASTSLAGGSFLLLFARIADLFGRRWMFVGSLFLFALFSLAAGFARTPISLDVLTGVMGLMSAAAVPPAQGMLGVIYDKPSKRKNAAFACFSAGNPLGFVLGMICSGIATQVFGWRASFWWLALVYVIFAVIAFFIVPNDTRDKTKLGWSVWKKFDILGVVLTVAGTGMFSAALTLGSDAPQGWKTGYVLALLIIGLACLVAFVFWELHVEDPLIQMSIFKDRNFSLVSRFMFVFVQQIARLTNHQLLAILLLGFVAFPTASFWISLYIQRVWQASPLKVAVYLLPMAIAGLAVNVVAAFILHSVSNKLLMGIGALAYTVAFMLYALNKTSYSYWAMVFPALCLSVVGADFQFNVANVSTFLPLQLTSPNAS